MKRGEIYRTQEKIPERGHKPGYYIVVSRDFVARNEDLSTVICAPVYKRDFRASKRGRVGSGGWVAAREFSSV